ncbi:unnamed protein product [Mortierella alpina]
MLHRLRMQSFQLQQQQLQQQQLQQQPLVFDQDMSSLHSLDSISAYDWDQAATLGPNPLSSNLSLDMLLSMGSSSGSPDSQASSSSTNEVDQHDIFNLGPLPQQQNSLSSIPLVPFSGDYSVTVSSSSPIALSSIPSLSTSSPSQDQPLATATALPQQTYYELLMAANPNEPLSQLLSTSATVMGPSSTYTTASPTQSSSAVEHPSAYAVLDSPGSSFATASSSSAPTLLSQNCPSADPIPTAFPLASIRISSSSDAQQQTVPLTTKEIMDALSGQFPIQPITASQLDLAVSVSESSSAQESYPVALESPTYLSTSQPLSSTEASSASETAAPLSPPLADTSVAAAVLAAIRAVETFSHVGSATDSSSASVGSDANEKLEAVSTMPTLNATAPLFPSAALDLEKVSKKLEDMNTNGQSSSTRPLLIARVTGVDAASGSAIPEDHSRVADINNSHPETALEPEETFHTPSTLPSPLPSATTAPAKASVRSRKSTRPSATQRRSSRASSRPYKERNMHSRNSEVYEDVQDEDEQSSKRGRSSDEDASSSSCSSPESSPPSPKTPPPLTDTHSTAHEHEGHVVPGIKSLDSDHDHDHMLSHHDHDHGDELKSLKRSSHPVCEERVDAPAPKLRKKKIVRVRTAQSVDGEEPGDESDAGILSPSLLPRYSSSQMTTRRSARISRHRNPADLSEAHSLASSNVPRLVGGRASRPAVA